MRKKCGLNSGLRPQHRLKAGDEGGLNSNLGPEHRLASGLRVRAESDELQGDDDGAE